MKKLIVVPALLAILLSACTEAGPGNPLTPPTPRPTEVARPPATPTTPGNPPSNPPTVPTAPGGGSTVGNPPGGGTLVSNSCPSLAEARRLMGVDLTLVGQENCAYTFNSGDGSFKPVNLPRDWFATTAEEDQLIYVQDGDGSVGRIKAKAATWRHKPSYPGLTLEKQFELQFGYSALPQNQFQGSNRCRGCAGFAPQAPGAPAATVSSADAQSGCPKIGSIQTTEIPGGCLWKSATPADLVVPAPYTAHYGVPEKTAGPNETVKGITQASLYK